MSVFSSNEFELIRATGYEHGMGISEIQKSNNAPRRSTKHPPRQTSDPLMTIFHNQDVDSWMPRGGGGSVMMDRGNGKERVNIVNEADKSRKPRERPDNRGNSSPP